MSHTSSSTTAPIADNFKTISSPAFHTRESFNYVITHVFLPVDLPNYVDYTPEKALSLARAASAAAHAYNAHIRGTREAPKWHHIARILDSLQAAIQSKGLDRDRVVSQLHGMETGDIVPFFISYPSSELAILTRRENHTLFESFDGFINKEAVESTPGRLIRSFPQFSFEIENKVFDDESFQLKLADVFCRSHVVDSDFSPSLLAHAEYITVLRTGLASDRASGYTADIPLITKHIRDEVSRGLMVEDDKAWRRSSLWLIIRIAIQASLDRRSVGRVSYKSFLLFFLCTIAKDPNVATLSTDQLHLMASKILRRMGKLGSSIPDWLFQTVLKTCAGLREILDARWERLSVCPSPFRNPSQDELRRDTQLSLGDSHEYICNALGANHVHRYVHPPFHPNHCRRGTINDFLSSNGGFFDKAYSTDSKVTLYDVEQLVEGGLDDWVASVTDVDEACTQLVNLMHTYMSRDDYGSPEDESIKGLTSIELFVAIDNLVVKKIPMLADYSPEISVAALEGLLLRTTMGIHRFSRVQQYLSARQSQSRPGWSVFSHDFTKDSFPVRYYDRSPYLQQLKVRIEEETISDGISHSLPLPSLPSHTKVIVFELQCPACIRVWRSAVAQICNYFYPFGNDYNDGMKMRSLVEHIPALQPYGFHHDTTRTSVEIGYFCPAPWQSPTPPKLRYGHRKGDDLYKWQGYWRDGAFREFSFSWKLFYGRPCSSCEVVALRPQPCFPCRILQQFVNSTFHTANGVLAVQSECPADLSLDEFIAFGQLRSGGSLQWHNILQGLRSRTLNLRRHHVHYLLAHAVSQVGPFDPNTGIWIWHQDLQEPSFCITLIDELDNLFADVGASSVDGMVMRSISLLLARVLASSPSEGISERAIVFLQRLRKKTFNWVQDFSYNLAKAPMNKERSKLLLDMALSCRSTFDVDSTALHKLFRSTEDVGVLISCSLFIRVLDHRSPLRYPRFSANVDSSDSSLELFLSRSRRLSVTLEEILRDVILADPSNYGIDLAVLNIFPSHKPSMHKWETLQHPNTRWLTCRTTSMAGYPSQTVHLNLLNGTLRVDGQPLGGLPRAIRDNPVCRRIFHNQGFFLIPSNLPGMDFSTLAMTSKYKVHFSLQDDNLVVRAQCNESKDILELVPSRRLKKDLPLALVRGHVHWLNLSTNIIEIRPLKRLWEKSAEDWKIGCTPGRYRMYKGYETLVEFRSPTGTMISKSFECLCITHRNSCHRNAGLDNLSNYLIITTSPIEFLHFTSPQRLSVALPHYGLSFFVNAQGELESRDFKDMVYDENQCVEALIGLKSMLALRQKAHLPEGLIPRCVLVPNGLPERDKDGQVRIKNMYTRDGKPVYYIYSVDTELGCLVGDGSLASSIYLAELHCMTSYDRPDPLTGKMGAQAALFILQSGGCRSIMKLKDPGNICLPYPQIKGTHLKIRSSYYYWRHDQDDDSPRTKRRMERAAYLFPWDAAGLTPRKDLDYHGSGYSTTLAPMKQELLALQYIPTEQTPWQVTLEQLLSDRMAPELPSRINLPHDNHKQLSVDITELNQLFCALPVDKSSASFQQRYIALLEESAQCAREDSSITHILAEKDVVMLRNHYARCRAIYWDALHILKESLGPRVSSHEQALEQFGHWPPITANFLLRCLASTSPIINLLSTEWKECLVSLALLLLDLQRARRLLRFALDGLEEELSKELENEGCDGWNPKEYPDWLLIQIQGNFLIRRVQAEIAMEMISPKSGRNTVMQVNMGEGKSSVIIPIVAAVLADGKQLVRVIVPKALTAQMFDTLVTRLGGLTNRPIYHLPFSRSSEYNEIGQMIGLHIGNLQNLMSQCMTERGILLVQPEHVASLKLMCIEEQIREGKCIAEPSSKVPKSLYERVKTSLLLEPLSKGSFVGNMFQWVQQSANHPNKKGVTSADQEHGEQTSSEDYDYTETSNEDYAQSVDAHCADSAYKWLNLQKWMDSHVRDILDETDEILHPRFQLIYTFGLERHIDGYPNRWTIIQQVLRLVKECVHALSKNHPNSMEYESGPPGSFPHFGIVGSSDIGTRLMSMIVEGVLAGRLPNFNFPDISTELRDAIRSFISDENVLQLPDTVKVVEDYAKHSDQSCVWNGLLILRGLFVCNILLFALTDQRWRVNYGLASQTRDSDHSPTPTKLAVPYRSKDTPALNTQFSQPDIIIILTCLSYYYSGLDEEQLRTSFEILLDQDDPSIEYAHWVGDYDEGKIPESLQTLGGIHLKSSEQWDKIIFPLFCKNQAAINFYLSQVVFPKEAKGFPWKLYASSWDLAEEREKVITGFSGTNDNQWLLPMSITQRDLDHQRGTNAKALAYLLRPENNFYAEINPNGERQTTYEFLQVIAKKQPRIRIILDVGAQILDLSNVELAKTWLDIAKDAAGAIYFNENDELMALMRNGTPVPMSSSPLLQQLCHCVVYLDHAHTRGTDLKLPVGSRAAVTLGPKLTKDRLVQGCMRMRKLGHGHSVMFFAPPEVDLSLRTLAGKEDSNAQVTTVDILRWAIHETWTDIQQRAPYWAQQGMNYKLRRDAWTRFCKDELTSEQLSDAWLQPDIKSLEDLYAPCEAKHDLSTLVSLDQGIRQRCKDLGILSFPSSQMDEEQEREVHMEREREREAELPPAAEPAEHFLHPDVVAFVKTGFIPSSHSRSAFRPVFTTLENSTASTREADVWSPSILATADFCNTIKLESTQGTIDQYLRPIQWVLSSKKECGQVLVLLSPFEVNCLMSHIRDSEYVHLHLYSPRTSRRMQPSDDLKLYSIPTLPFDWTPPWALIDQLNVFAGQLYLRDYNSYIRLCRFLEVPTDELPSASAVRRNLFDIPGSFEETEITFSGSPLPSVMALLAIRTRGRTFAHTHMGKILQGKILKEKDFEGPRPVASGNTNVACDKEIPNSFASVTGPSSPMDVECDPKLPGSFSSAKRRLGMTETSNAAPEPSQKRLRLN